MVKPAVMGGAMGLMMMWMLLSGVETAVTRFAKK
jgi:hypothetical protein